MPIEKLFTSWLDPLASLLASAKDRWRIRRSLMVVETEAGFALRRSGSETPSPIPPEVIRKAGRHFVVLELSPSEIVQQRIDVPVQAREFLAGIVRNQIERLSPWRADQVAFGFAAEPNRADPAQLDVHVCMAASESVEAARSRLQGVGLAADRVVTARREGAQPVTLWSRLGDASGHDIRSARRQLAIALGALIVLSGSASAWAILSAAAIRADCDDLTVQADQVQRRLQGSHGGADALRDPAQRAWALKTTAPAAVLILDSLSKALPDGAYVTDLSLARGTLRLSGQCDDAPSLLAPLEQSQLMTAVHFFAPTTRGPDGSSYLFHVEGQIGAPSIQKEM